MEEAIRALLETLPITAPPFDAYKPLIVDGLVFFIMNLPEERRNAIAAEQLELGDASTNERIVALLRHCPTLHKLGQVVSHERSLPKDFRDRLQFLESLPASGDLGPTIDRIHAEIGEIPGLTIAPEALAQGSVAVVVPFTLEKRGRTQRGIFKVLLPGVEQRLDEDLAIWPRLAELMDERSHVYGLPPVDFKGFLDGVGRLLRDEIKLEREQRQLVKAASFYADMPTVVIPKLFPFCTPAVTAMERVDGVKLTEAGLDGVQARKVAETVVNALLAKPFWQGGKRALFHADPHAGNLLVLPDGRVAILDWALTTTLDSRQLAAVVQALVCATTLDENGMYRALARLGVIADQKAIRVGITSALGQIRMGRMPGFTWLVSLLDDLARAGSIVFVEEAVLFRKAVLTLTGVVADVWGGASVDSVVIATGAMQFVREAPLRPLIPIGSRRLGSHLSTWDLILYSWSLPWAPARFIAEGLRAGFTAGDAAANDGGTPVAQRPTSASRRVDGEATVSLPADVPQEPYAHGPTTPIPDHVDAESLAAKDVVAQRAAAMRSAPDTDVVEPPEDTFLAEPRSHVEGGGDHDMEHHTLGDGRPAEVAAQ